ncbi:MAG TPA: hypothetical protein VEU32_20820 [Burkholderiales bacterium]|nr:hypothetical protein [Burkholderiales bacterium]
MKEVFGVGRQLNVLAGLALLAGALFAASAYAQWGVPSTNSGTPNCKSVMLDELAIYKASLDAAPTPTGRARTAQQYSSNDTYMTLAARAQQVQANNGPTALAECNNVRGMIAAERAKLSVEVYDCTDHVEFDLVPNTTLNSGLNLKGGPRAPFDAMNYNSHVTVRFSSAEARHVSWRGQTGAVVSEENDMFCHYKSPEGIDITYMAKAPAGRTCKVSSSKPSRFECTR